MSTESGVTSGCHQVWPQSKSKANKKIMIHSQMLCQNVTGKDIQESLMTRYERKLSTSKSLPECCSFKHCQVLIHLKALWILSYLGFQESFIPKPCWLNNWSLRPDSISCHSPLPRKQQMGLNFQLRWLCWLVLLCKHFLTFQVLISKVIH